jgi:hypothetical protein
VWKGPSTCQEKNHGQLFSYSGERKLLENVIGCLDHNGICYTVVSFTRGGKREEKRPRMEAVSAVN